MIEVRKPALNKITEHQSDIIAGNFTWLRRLEGKLGSQVVKAFWEAGIPPFSNLPLELVDDPLLMDTIHGIYNGFDGPTFVKGLDPYQIWSDSTAWAIAAVAEAAGMAIWFTGRGFWGSDDYLITRDQPIERTIEAHRDIMYDYTPMDFARVHQV